ncbi:MAG TPA: dephospho-CoA kinase [Propionibacteriaceae bacterium]|jgi:dephospho-CoA kinase|nr:dephospho-CoA kinase [Propionibacteriaceae bacterium]
MFRVALTGGIASGKSMVAAELAARGAIIIDADVLAREVVEPGSPALAAIIDRFGEQVVTEGRLDRPRLAQLVFADPLARRDLERIVHPAVRVRAAELERAAGPAAIVVHVIPLLVETGQQGDFDLVVTVDVDHETQIQRLMARNEFTRAEAESRVAAQATREDRKIAADVVVDNTGSVTQLREQIDALWAELSSAVARQ